jgi:putative flippase GtrA
MNSWANQARQSRIWMFLAVGATNTLIGYSIFAIGYKLAGLNYNVALLVAYALGISIAYLNHRRITFKSSVKHQKAVVRFVMTYLLVYVLNAALLIALSEWAGIDPLYGQAISLAIVTLMSFVIQQAWVFKT